MFDAGHLPVFWINLETSTSRRRKMLAEFAHAGIPERNLVRIDAVHPALLSGYAFRQPAGLPDISMAEQCCTLSHLKAIWTALKSGAECALIAEDDLRIIRWVGEKGLWDSISAHAPPDWMVLQLVALGDAMPDLLRHSSDLWVPWRSGIWCTCAYAINRRGMERVLGRYAAGTIRHERWEDTDHVVDFASMRRDDARARCVADWALYVAATTYTCTDVFLTEVAEDSTLNPTDLPCHRSTTRVVSEIAKNDAFKFRTSSGQDPAQRG